MLFKKSSNAAGNAAGIRDDRASTSPPPIAIRRSNTVFGSQTPQLSDVSDDDARYTEEATPTQGIRHQSSAEFPITPLQAPIAFLKPYTDAAANPQSFEIFLQAQTAIL